MGKFIVNKYLNHLTEIDCDEAYECVARDFGLFMYIIPFYWIMDTNTKKVLRVVYFGTIELAMTLMIVFSLMAMVHAPDLTFVVKCFNTILLVAVAIFKGWSYFRARRSISVFYKYIHDGFMKYNDFEKGKEEAFDDARKRFENKLSKYITIAFYLVTSIYIGYQPFADTLEGNVDSENVVNGINKKFPLPMWTPYDSNDPLLFWITSVFIMFTCSMSGATIMIGTLAFALGGERIINQITILNYATEHLEERAIRQWRLKNNPRTVDTDYSDTILLHKNREYSIIYRNCLIKIIKHHCIILRCCDAFKHVFSIPISIVVILGSMMIALGLFCIADNATPLAFKIVSGYLVFVEASVFGMMCYYGEMISHKLEDFRFAIYQTNWPDSSESNKQFIRIIQERTIKPTKMKDYLIGAHLNLKLFANIVKTSYSYVNLIYMLK